VRPLTKSSSYKRGSQSPRRLGITEVSRGAIWRLRAASNDSPAIAAWILTPGVRSGHRLLPAPANPPEKNSAGRGGQITGCYMLRDVYVELRGSTIRARGRWPAARQRALLREHTPQQPRGSWQSQYQRQSRQGMPLGRFPPSQCAQIGDRGIGHPARLPQLSCG
jgi:hypothetical protein